MSKEYGDDNKEWVSPSDLLIGKLQLKPPFTAKVTRGETHQGIIKIANEILDWQRQRFLAYLSSVLKNNEEAWKDALEREKEVINAKVKILYDEIFKTKSNVISKEISNYYANSLQELENCARDELSNIIIVRHADLLSELNTQIQKKLEKERKTLDDVLQSKYDTEIAKATDYYDLLLKDQLDKHENLLNSLVIERNQALKAFVTQAEAENQTSTIYVMSLERKKCEIKHLTLKKYQATEIKEKLSNIKAKQEVLDDFQNNGTPACGINKEWEDKLSKLLELFMKFISYSLELLPEQSVFLLDFEKIFINQLTEMQKTQKQTPNILINIDETFALKFPTPKGSKDICNLDPLVVEGDPSDPKRKKYGSRDTIPSDVSLPIITVEREFVYARCHKFEEIQKLWDETRCKCNDPIFVVNPNETVRVRESARNFNLPSSWHPLGQEVSSASSLDTLLVEDRDHLTQCPARKCQNLFDDFPYLYNYIDYSDENYARVKALLSGPSKIDYVKINPARDIAQRKLQFEMALKPSHDVGTHYSSQESLDLKISQDCKCMQGLIRPIHVESFESINEDKCKTGIKSSLIDFIANGCFDF